MIIRADASKLPPRFDLKTKPKTPKGAGKQAPKPKEFKPRPIELDTKFSSSAVDNFLGAPKTQIAPSHYSLTKKLPAEVSESKLNAETSVKTTPAKKLVTKEPESNYITLAFNEKDWLFTQATALCSVIIDKDGFVTPDTAEFVNDNANCWDDKDLVKYYRSFVGAHNFKNHVAGNTANERARNSYGVVIDAVLRPIKTEAGSTIHYVDLLIATNKTLHSDFTKMIEKGDVRYTSMGCESSACRCTYCGRVFLDTADTCEHILYDRGSFYMNRGGKKIKVAEQVCDYPNNEGEGFIEFVEISYLTENPAFKGAAKSHKIEIEKGADLTITIPRKYWAKEAFQVWKTFIKVVR